MSESQHHYEKIRSELLVNNIWENETTSFLLELINILEREELTASALENLLAENQRLKAELAKMRTVLLKANSSHMSSKLKDALYE